MNKKYLSSAISSISRSNTLNDLDIVKQKFLGKNSELMLAIKNLSKIENIDKKRSSGKKLNEIKSSILNELKNRSNDIKNELLISKLKKDIIDTTLSNTELVGTFHPITKIIYKIESIFKSQGFKICDGNEVETEYYNFTALNFPEHHPAIADHDTFYFDTKALLRTHTSPTQIHEMEKNKELPLLMISPGRVYRCDFDITHTPMFHQIEGLVVGENVSFVNLKYTLSKFLKIFFEDDSLKTRFRPSFFPFTEPSVEVDISCSFCNLKGCRSCKGSGWIEILGAGMVHPNVFKNVGICTNTYTGFAFGLGIERLAMLYYNVDDIRLFYDNNKDFLLQFQ